MKRQNLKLRIYGILSVVVAILVSVVAITLGSISASAFTTEDTRETTDETLLKKTLLNGLDQYCYSDTYMIKSVVGSEFSVWGVQGLLTSEGDDKKIIKVPTNVGDTLTDATVTCREAFLGASRRSGFLWWKKSEGAMPGLFDLYGKTVASTNITDMGYVLDESAATGADEKCLYVDYKAPNGTSLSSFRTNSVCFKIADGKIQTGYYDVRTNDDGNGGPISIYYNDTYGSLMYKITGYDIPFGNDIGTAGWAYDGASGYRSWSDFVSHVKYVLSGEWGIREGGYEIGYKGPITSAFACDDDRCMTMSPIGFEYLGVGEIDGEGERHEIYKKSQFGVWTLIRYLTGDSSTNEDTLKFTSQEEYDLLKTYFLQKLGNEIYLDSENCTRDKAKAKEATGYAYFDNTVSLWCPVSGVDHVNSGERFNIVGSNRRTLNDVDFKNVMQRITDWDFEATGVDPGTSGVTPVVPSPSDPGESGEPNCFTDGSSLGWILCPALEIMGNAVNGLYDEIADKWLEIGTKEMEAVDSNGVYVGWKTFRDMANIIFVIMLIIVIFSQVTGLGLTNYGIKKTLPTLIMVAVLVNLSFIICQLAVDVTNILGDGLRNMFEGFTVATGTGFGISDIVQGIFNGVIHIAVIGGTAAALVHFSGASIAMLLVPLLLALISALIGTIVFFLSLAIRKAGIFAMVILCPVAIICYALPNTKKFFDRWLKLFTGLLMIYPICGILMGGGKFFSSVLLTSGSNGFFMALTAMLVQVIPFFFIPTLVKGSLNMIGNLGTKLSNLGSRFTRSAQGMLGRSRWAQDRQQRLAREANIRRDTRLAARGQKLLRAMDAKTANGGQLSKREQRRYRRAEYETARAAARFRRTADEDARAAVEAKRDLPTEGSMQYTNMMAAYENAAREREINEFQAAMLNGKMSYGSGANEQEIDVNNLGKIDPEGRLQAEPNSEKSLSAALLHYLNAYDNAADKNSAKAQNDLLRAQAIATRLLDAGGDNGQTIVTNALRGRSFAANGVAKARDDMQAASRLSEYIARNGKWMGQIKKTDVGSFAFLNDAANKTANLKSRAEYHTMGDKKITAAAIPGLSDGFFEGLMQEINAPESNSVFSDINGGAAQRLIEIDNAAQRALADERIANELKPETLEHLKKIHDKAYKIQRERWLNGQDDSGSSNISQLSGYDSAGNEVNATGMDSDGYLINSAGQRLLSAANGGVQLKATDAYSNQIRRYVEYEAGKKPTTGEVKILHKKEMPQGWQYSGVEGKWKYIDIARGINRDLTPEEVARAKMITQYNAEIDQQNADNNA